ncbi:ribosomal protein L15 [Tilletiaria anomala UBC 951]|uniref:Ribosomal protein L15 n=1 Tax=Tilletiaria anomala (strain ATCC 24038 / CBS 436.72 / UBC 951) TaxID=1037660 RepID=A0A066VTP8_TILAU|nr:ribosomal protein L15 [Tilletiaria anomala UBC 951]KDN42189.1 ribosomal protein L15 [Tilletiaria anomala UBC 951]
MSASLTRSLGLLSLRSGSGALAAATTAATAQAAHAIGSTSRVTLGMTLAFSQGPIQRRGYASEALGPISLGNLKPAVPTKNRKRLGRGPGSGRGGTATRGHKGQKARSGNGKPTPGFEGGQTPIMRRFPKRGFTNIHGHEYAPVNLDRIQYWIDLGLLDPAQPITAAELLHSRCIHQVKDGVKILADGATRLRTRINLIVSKASQSAIKGIERVGGSVECRYYNRLSLTALVKPHKWIEKGKLLPLPAEPTKKRDLLYYASPNKRGYLAKRAIGAAIAQRDVESAGPKSSPAAPSTEAATADAQSAPPAA